MTSSTNVGTWNAFVCGAKLGGELGDLVAKRPTVIAFDVIETLFPLEPMSQRLIDAGLAGHLLELWFSRLLRDAFALVASGGYRAFADIASAALGLLALRSG